MPDTRLIPPAVRARSGDLARALGRCHLRPLGLLLLEAGSSALVFLLPVVVPVAAAGAPTAASPVASGANTATTPTDASTTHASVRTPVGSISMDFPEPTPLDVVARHVAIAVGAGIVVASGSPRITVFAPKPVDRAEAFAVFEAAVEAAGWTIIRAGPVYRIVPAKR